MAKEKHHEPAFDMAFYESVLKRVSVGNRCKIRGTLIIRCKATLLDAG